MVSSILVDARLAGAEDVHLVADRLPLDEHARLLLPRMAGRGHAGHLGPVRGVGRSPTWEKRTRFAVFEWPATRQSRDQARSDTVETNGLSASSLSMGG